MIIRSRTYPSGRTVHQVDFGKVNGRRKMRSYRTKDKAEGAVAKELAARRVRGTLGGDISALEMAQIVTARERLREAGSTIPEAVEFFMAHARAVREPLSLAELAQRFRDSRDRKGLSVEYVDQLATSIGGLVKRYPLAEAHEVTPAMVKAWLEAGEGKKGKWKAKTRNGYLGDVSAMYEWALLPTQGHARSNPCTDVERAPDDRRGMRASLSVEQAELALRAAHARQDWRVLTYLVLGMLGGIRPEEMTRQEEERWLRWEDVHLGERTVRLNERVVKTGPGRVVDLTKEAVVWLRLVPTALRTGPVVPRTNWPMRWLRFRYELGWRVASDKVIAKQCLPVVRPIYGEWPKDVLRKTFASMHYAHHQNEALLQVQMGHESATMLREYYRAVRTRAEGAAFWRLAPWARGKTLVWLEQWWPSVHRLIMG